MTKNVQGECQHCRGLFEFPAEQAGLTAECPLCGQPTELMLATPLDTGSPSYTKAIVFTVMVVVIVVVGVAGSLVALKRAKRMYPAEATATTKAKPVAAVAKAVDPFEAQGFRVSAVTLELTPGSALRNARGTIMNVGSQPRYGLKVELDLFDASGKRVANTADYISVLETNAEWKFTALVGEGKAVSGKVVTIKETK